MTIGLRNNNPLNIRRVAGQHWKGEVLPPLGEDRGRLFCKFSSMKYGLRAAFVLLRTYSSKYKLNSIRDIVTRWAPPSENDTEAYIRTVCCLTGFGGNQRLTEQDWPKLVQAMAKVESDALLPIETIMRGFALYQEAKKKSSKLISY